MRQVATSWSRLDGEASLHRKKKPSCKEELINYISTSKDVFKPMLSDPSKIGTEGGKYINGREDKKFIVIKERTSSQKGVVGNVTLDNKFNPEKKPFETPRPNGTFCTRRSKYGYVQYAVVRLEPEHL